MHAQAQAAAPWPDHAAASAQQRELARSASLELAPRQLAGYDRLTDHLLPGTEVYVPFPPKARWQETVAACGRLLDAGMVPVPHLAARTIRDAKMLDARLAQLAAAGVDSLLLIAGDAARPAGAYRDALAVLDSGKLLEHGFRRLAVAAHPEGHPKASAADLKAAIWRKREYAAATGTEMWFVTQFVFAAAPAIAWLTELQDTGLSVRIGLPGPARLRTLITFAARCGVGASVQALTRRPGVVRLFGNWSPDALLRDLATHRASQPDSPLAGIHLFAFGGLPTAARWLRSQRRETGPQPAALPQRFAALAHRPPLLHRPAPAHRPRPPEATDQEIAASVPLRPILPLAQERLRIGAEHLIPFGHYKAKLSLAALPGLTARPQGKLVLVTAISPTAAGEGKTTTSIGLADALNRLGTSATVCLREPSLGPCFGAKGGATGGGWSQIAPMADINLHFNGDLHAVTAANNLLAAMLDNHLYWGNKLGIDPATVVWRRAIDLNDRALRDIDMNVGRGKRRTGGFDITAASEVMAVLCLAHDQADLQERLARIVLARRYDGEPVSAGELNAAGAAAALLTDALQPNLVQSLEGNPAFVHGGPFANIAHGCNSVVATRAALALSDVVVTEAGFGADLGAEKFLNIKCRQSGLRPAAAVLVCTVRALKLHGGIVASDLAEPNVAAVRAGAANLTRHIDNLRRFGLAPVVAINRFASDTDAELAAVEDVAAAGGAASVVATHWENGGAGAEALAGAVLDTLNGQRSDVQLLYPDDLPLREKLYTVATRIYGASAVALDAAAERQLDDFERLGYGHLPVCVAKTQYSFSADQRAFGAPSGHVLPVREARLCAGAGFVVAICGNIMTMPGLPRRPAALDIGLDEDGRVAGL